MVAMSAEGLRAAEEKMRTAGQAEEAILGFRRSYERVDAGESAYLRSEDLEPVSEVAALEGIAEVDPHKALERVAVIKLNGGLATTMGLRQPKSLIEAREGHTFLDIIIGQVLALRERHQVTAAAPAHEQRGHAAGNVRGAAIASRARHAGCRSSSCRA